MIPCLQESWRAIFSDYPLQSPSFSVSHGSLMEVDMYGINPATPEGLSERPYTCHFFIIIKSTQDWLFYIVVFLPKLQHHLGSSVPAREIFLELHRRQPHLMIFLLFLQEPCSTLLRQTTLIILAFSPCLTLIFSLIWNVNFDLLYSKELRNLSLQRQLLSLLCLYQLTTQNQSHLFLHPRHFPNQLLQRISVNIPSYILHTSKSSPPYYQSDDLMNDLRFFFAGAPSFEENDFVARLLQSTNLETRR